MGLTENLVEIKSEIESLIAFANEKTGESEATIGDAILRLVDGYGQGSGGVEEGEFTSSGKQANSIDVHIFDINIGTGKKFFFAYNSTVTNLKPSFYFLTPIGSGYMVVQTSSSGSVNSGGGSFNFDNNGATHPTEGNRFGYYDEATGELYFTVKAWNSIDAGTYKWFAW